MGLYSKFLLEITDRQLPLIHDGRKTDVINGYYADQKKNKTMQTAATWMEQEERMLNEVNRKETGRYRMIFFKCTQ